MAGTSPAIPEKIDARPVNGSDGWPKWPDKGTFWRCVDRDESKVAVRIRAAYKPATRGEVPERSIGAVSKTVVPYGYPGFESLLLRHSSRLSN